MDPSKEGLLRSSSRSSLDSDDPQAAPPSSPLEPPRPRRSTKTLAVVSTACLVLLALLAGLYKAYTSPPADGQSPPWYPSPKGGTASTWAASYAKASSLVSRMTLAEKVNVTTGTGWQMGLAVGTTGPATHVGFPALALQDGPLGIRFADNATAFPAGVTVGATWNRALMRARGAAHGLEARQKGINVLLGPCVGPLGRMPAGGRNWEGFGSDPYLQGVAAAETIRGIQSQHVMATIKHFVANEQEHFRQAREWALPAALSSNVDDRTLHELYAWPFADAVRAGVASVMCSYNMVNNSYACANSKLLNGVLKDEMGFQGFVMSDWLAQRSGVASALAGLDMTMPGDGLVWQDGESLWGPELSRAVLNGSVPVERLDDMVTRVVAAWYQLGQDDEELFGIKGPNFSSWTDEERGVPFPGSPSEQEEVVVNRYVDVQADHKDVARQVAAEGTVLLKNEGILPLGRDGSTASKKVSGKVRVGIFGEDAGPGEGANACPDRGCNQGTLASGWGSGAVEFPYLVTPLEALRQTFDSNVALTEHLSNTVKSSDLNQDICIVFANSDAGEGYMSWSNVRGDRPDLLLQKGSDDLVRKVATGCPETIVVLHTVGPVTLENWIDLPGVKAVVLANLPGQESGNALVDILSGDVSPSGKLPYTMGKRLEDYGPGGQVMYYPNAPVPQQDFEEGVFVDYRYFDKEGIEPRYEFGYGLSYTTFEIRDVVVKSVRERTEFPSPRPEPGAEPPKYARDIPNKEEAEAPPGFRKLEKYVYPYIEGDIREGDYPYPDGYAIVQPPSQAGGAEGGNPDLWETYATVSATVTNTGPRAGKVVAQLYMRYPAETPVEVPPRVLRGFEKVELESGEEKVVEFSVTRRDLSYWDVGGQNWRVVKGEYGFFVGESSRGGVEGVLP